MVEITDQDRMDWLDQPSRRWTFWLGRNKPNGYWVMPVFGKNSIRTAIDKEIIRDLRDRLDKGKP